MICEEANLISLDWKPSGVVFALKQTLFLPLPTSYTGSYCCSPTLTRFAKSLIQCLQSNLSEREWYKINRWSFQGLKDKCLVFLPCFQYTNLNILSRNTILKPNRAICLKLRVLAFMTFTLGDLRASRENSTHSHVSLSFSLLTDKNKCS